MGIYGTSGGLSISTLGLIVFDSETCRDDDYSGNVSEGVADSSSVIPNP